VRFIGITLTAVALAAAGCGGEEDTVEPGGMPVRTVEVAATEFAFDPAAIELEEAGTYAFTLRNDGSTEHALEIEGGDVEVETDTIGGGETAELTVDLPAGTYELYCPVGDHRGRGMEGTVTVAGGTTGATTTGTDEDESGYGYGYG
jgi:uncharacterized cupredoxin-like copper-binding protein